MRLVAAWFVVCAMVSGVASGVAAENAGPAPKRKAAAKWAITIEFRPQGNQGAPVNQQQD